MKYLLSLVVFFSFQVNSFTISERNIRFDNTMKSKAVTITNDSDSNINISLTLSDWVVAEDNSQPDLVVFPPAFVMNAGGSQKFFILNRGKNYNVESFYRLNVKESKLDGDNNLISSNAIISFPVFYIFRKNPDKNPVIINQVDRDRFELENISNNFSELSFITYQDGTRWYARIPILAGENIELLINEKDRPAIITMRNGQNINVK